MIAIYHFVADCVDLTASGFVLLHPWPVLIYYAEQTAVANKEQFSTTPMPKEELLKDFIRLRKNAHRYTVLPLDEPMHLRLGRSGTNDILLGEETVSKEHAQVRWEGGTLSVRDQATRNGTWVNEVRIEKDEWVPVSPGGILRFGSARMGFLLPEQFYSALTELLADNSPGAEKK